MIASLKREHQTFTSEMAKQLHSATVSGKIEATTELLKHGVAVDQADCHGNTPLMLAADQGHNPVLLRLLEYKASVNLQNSAGRTALMCAALVASSSRDAPSVRQRGARTLDSRVE